MKLCRSTIEKERHYVPNGKHTFEVDVFHGVHEGLIIAEIELSSEDEPFNRPDWLGEEVTGDIRYYNSYLSTHPFIPSNRS
jgi:CYTH domain-containing protein